jgi:hypothetical protein
MYWLIAHSHATLDHMDLFSLNAETAKNIGLGSMGGSVLGWLFVLKFVKSLVTKILMLALFAGIAVLSFTQRDALSICAAKFEVRESSIQDTSCSFFGQDISLSKIKP